MSVFKSKSRGKNYWIQFQYNGELVSQSSRTTNKQLAKQIEKQLLEQKIREHELGQLQRISIRDAIRMYVVSKQDIVTHRRLEYLERYMLKSFNVDRSLETFSEADVERIIQRRKEEGVSGQTIKHLVNMLRGMWKHAKKLRYQTQPIDFPTVRVAKHRLRYLSHEEEQRLLKELSPTYPESQRRQAQQDNYDLVVFLLDVGCRYSEAAKLQWSDIDLDSRTINLYRPKVRNESVLFITDRLYNVLNRRKRASTNEYVFNDKEGSGPRKHTTIAIRKAFRRAGLTDATVHDLRHTFASRLAQAGFSLQEIATLLGHASIQTTMRYSHLIPNTVAKRATDHLNSLNDKNRLRVV